MADNTNLASGKVIGGHFHDDTTSALTAQAMAASAPTKAEYDALATKFNTLLTQLRANGVIK